MTDTIYALATGRPPAAIAVVRVSGHKAHDAAQALAGALPEPRQASLRQLRRLSDQSVLDEALVLRFDGPHSATGEDVVEFHCHGSRAVVEAVLGALGETEGTRLAEPGEFTRRAFENGRIDLTEAEGLADLLEAETESQRRSALAMAEGGLRQQILQWQDRLLALSARAEAGIDYADEDDVSVDEALYRDCGALALELRSWLSKPRAEPLKDGVRVVVAGPTNAGKSSLINALSESDRAIVTDIPGTTRDHIEVPLALGGTPILLIDTAGLRETDEVVESIGIERAWALVRSSDILLWLGKPSDAPEHPRLIQVQAKSDLLPASSEIAGLRVSTVTGEGLKTLLEQVRQLAASLLPADGALALNRRQAQCIAEAEGFLTLAEQCGDLALAADSLRGARSAFDQLTGRAGVEDVLDSLFGRFCLGK